MLDKDEIPVGAWHILLHLLTFCALWVNMAPEHSHVTPSSELHCQDFVFTAIWFRSARQVPCELAGLSQAYAGICELATTSIMHCLPQSNI